MVGHMGMWDRIRGASDASRRRMKSAGREVLDRVDSIDQAVLSEDDDAQARAMAKASLAPHGYEPPPASFIAPPAPSWTVPSPPAFPADPDLTEEPEPASRFRNSMHFSDQEIETLIRVEHFPGREEVDLDTLYAACRVEGRLLTASLAVGRGWLHLVAGWMQSNEIWEAAVFFCGAHHDPDVEEAMEGAVGGADPDLRALGYALAPFAGELLGASRDADDPDGLRESLEILTTAWADRLQMLEDVPELAEELGRLPSGTQGVYGFRGFRWLDS